MYFFAFSSSIFILFLPFGRVLLKTFISCKKSEILSGTKDSKYIRKCFANAGEAPEVETAIVKSSFLINEGKMKSQYSTESTLLHKHL
jgi:hypothetical protein